MDNTRKREDSQILSEIVSNERIIEHPTRGKIKFRFPTLQIQRKVDAAARNRKKILRETVDEIPDPSSPSGFKSVSAYKSRQVLEHEYRESGWWTDEMESRLEDLSNLYIGYVTKLEILGFESMESTFQELEDIRAQLNGLISGDDEQENHEVFNSILRITTPTAEVTSIDLNRIKDAATSTDVDTLLDRVDVLREQYLAYTEMVKTYNEVSKLDQEKNSLFADSWQSQLEYYTRLAQVFYCVSYVDNSKPLYEKIEDIELEQDTEFVTWLFTELQALWQGLTDESRERMGKYSFTRRLSTAKSSSEDLDAQPEIKVDGDSLEKMPSTSIIASGTVENSPQSSLISLNT